MNRNTFTHALFEQLRTTEYLLLKHTASALDHLDDHTDLDILLPDGVSPSLTLFFEQHPLVDFVRWGRWADRRSAFVFFKDGSFLQVDFLTHLARKSQIYLPNRLALANKRQTTEGIVTYSDQYLLEHAVLFSALNHSGLSEKYLRHFDALPEKEQTRLTELFNFKYKTALHTLLQLAYFYPDVQRALLGYIKNLPENRFWPRQKRFVAWLFDVVHSWLRPQGVVITFSGVDGAGKSTVLAAACERLRHIYRKNVVVLRHRPGLLPILSAWTQGKHAAEMQAASFLPHSGRNQSALSSLVRFGYYYLDYLVGQLWVWARWQTRGHVVLYDRYYFDFIADGRRSNLTGLPAWLTRLGYRLLRQPDLNFFLWAQPETILSRKKELSKTTIEGLTTNYKTLFEQLGAARPDGYVPLENRDFDRTMQAFDEKYRRLERRLAR